MMLFRNPYRVMLIAIAMYVVKIWAKLAVGAHVSSPMIEGDGFHNISDVFEGVIILGLLLLSARKANERFPFGFKMFENLGELLIGSAMLVMALGVLRSAATGFLSCLPAADAAVRAVIALPRHESVKLGAGTFPLVALATLGSAALSFIVGRHQIGVGRRHGRVSLVADGEETKSDGRIELAVFIGAAGEHLFRAPWLEYPFALIVSGMIAKTGSEILARGVSSLVKRSIGDGHEEMIRALAAGVRGIVEVAKLKTFRVGGDAVCLMKVLTRAPVEAHDDLKAAMIGRIAPKLRESGFPECHCFIRFGRPPDGHHRIAFAVMKEGSTLAIAPSAEAATHVLICDVEDGEIVRRKDWPKPGDIGAFLVEKRVRRLYVFAPVGFEETFGTTGIPVKNAASYAPEALGL